MSAAVTTAGSAAGGEWQRKVLCRYFMVGACQKGDQCPYSHDKNISKKGTLPCRFFQVGTCANGSHCRFSHSSAMSGGQHGVDSGGGGPGGGHLGGVDHLSAAMETLAFDQSEAGSEGSYDTSLGSYDESGSGWGPVMVEGGSYYDPMEQAGQYYDYYGQHGAVVSPVSVTLSPQVVVTVLPPVTDQHLVSARDQKPVETNNNVTSPPPPCDSNPDHQTNMIPLTKSQPWTAPSDWAEAAEFVPKPSCEEPAKPKSWAQVVNTGITYPGMELSSSQAESLLCPFYKVGECRYGVGCAYIHGETCDYCGQACLHPTHLDQRRTHLAECLQEHERNMELSFAVARSKEKTCGICMEIVLDKPKGEARFGILPSCNHCFCLPCIRKWRQAKQFEHKIIRACPECRQTSDYICPSRFWVETPEEKDRLLGDYKKNLGQKECKYFNKGSGECPFGNKCFYQHADKDGRVVDVGPPKKPIRRANADGNLSLVQRLLLYDFLEERDGQLVLPLDFVELLDLYSDTDEMSDNEETDS